MITAKRVSIWMVMIAIASAIAAVWLKADDRTSLADWTLPVPLYFALFFIVFSTLSICIIAIVMFSRWLIDQLLSTEG